MTKLCWKFPPNKLMFEKDQYQSPAWQRRKLSGIFRRAGPTATRIMVNAAKELFPELNVRCEASAAWRFHKDDAASLHKFCSKLGLKLKAEVGVQYKLSNEGRILQRFFPGEFDSGMGQRTIDIG